MAARPGADTLSWSDAALLPWLLRRVGEALGEVRIVDATYPSLSALRLRAGSRMVVPAAQTAGGLLRRFRQEGGRVSIPAASAPGLLHHLWRDHAALPVLAVAPDIATLLDLVPAVTTTSGVVACLLPNGEREAVAALAPVSRGDRLEIVFPARGGSSHLLLAGAAGAVSRLRQTLAPGLDAAGGDGPLELPCPEDAAAASEVVRVIDLVHDGGYEAEQKADYSWLWTGPDRHFRMLLGSLPPGGAMVNVSVPKIEQPGNVAGLRAMVNGRPAPHAWDAWSPTSGKLSVRIRPEDREGVVLSLAVPAVGFAPGGTRLLGMCIDRVEVKPWADRAAS